MSLPTETERVSAYLAMQEAELGALESVIVMCGCEDWMHCAHPYPGYVLIHAEKCETPQGPA